ASDRVTGPVQTQPDQDKHPVNSTVKEKIHLDPPQFIVGSAQSVGLQRDHNEDALFTLNTVLTSDTRKIPFGLFIIADGMGGHDHGEIASAIAIRSMASYVVNHLFLPLLNPTGKPPEQSIREVVHEGALEANRIVLKQVLGGGSTLTAIVVLGEQMAVVHVGDSRAYSISPDGKAEVLTRDHSLVARLIELGQLTIEEAATHPQRNVLYRALGQGEPFDPDISMLQVPREGFLLLCSDGLWGVITQEELVKIVIDHPDPSIACQKLVEVANTAGGPDNISVILVHLPG
ncbi:MAG: PP2C family protein-serine/threonine phosphatase, partial [Omnitrophica WOR_2 bacterium]